MIIPEWLYKEEQTLINNKIKKVYNPKTLKQIARENLEVNDKELDKELAKEMIRPYYFINENLKNGFKKNLDSHIINHANSFLTNTPNFTDFGIETRNIQKIIKKLSTIYARLINQYKFKNHTIISATLYEIKEEDQRSDEIELYNNLQFNEKLTEFDIDNIDIKSQLEHQSQIQETKVSG